MQQPLIAISMDHTAEPERAVLRDAYYEAVWAAGGLPVLVPPLCDSRAIERLLARAHALIMPGADDYHPALWGEATLDPRCVLVTARRQEADLRILRIALQRAMPLLAICGSMQLLNVVCGGSVVQHIEQTHATPVRHRSDGAEPARHEVRTADRSWLRRWSGRERLEVNSYHHQACGRLAPGWRAVAWAADGTIEAIEPAAPERVVLGVQWHPEKMIDEPAQRALFEGLCAAASARAAARERGR